MAQTEKPFDSGRSVTRKKFIQNCGMGVMAIAVNPLVSRIVPKKEISNLKITGKVLPLNKDWLFGGKFEQSMLTSGYNDTNFEHINLPHCVTNLSWHQWNPSDWQNVWIYRKYFTRPSYAKDMRAFLHFDGVMVGATPIINTRKLPTHLGGYLPFKYEITDAIKEENELTVIVDSRWSNVPPEGAEQGAKRIDYLEPGGIHRSVSVAFVPQVFISDVFVKPVNILQANRSADIAFTIDAAGLLKNNMELGIEIKKNNNVIAKARKSVHIEKEGLFTDTISISNLSDIELWDIDNPVLYDVEATLFLNAKPLHNVNTRTGFREAVFKNDGFYLNGKRLQIFGLNRHEIFPYAGFSLPDRIMYNDALIIKKEFNCNMVRCSHYPQTQAFLNACDELGLLVWEEIPGWNYIGDETWKALVLRDVKDMIIRDRNHPSIIVWGTRVNESPNEVELYKKTRALAKSLDDSRPSSGTMTAHSTKGWEEDIFAFDDYHADPVGSVGLLPAIEGKPYLFSEAVGQFNYAAGKGFNCMYRRDAVPKIQQLQAIYHAQAHNKAAGMPDVCGLIGWCAFEYSSLLNSYKAIKNPGIADVFRIPKLGASFYQSQCSPVLKPVIQPNFYWDFGSKSPAGPGKDVAIFANCDRLEVFINEQHYSTLIPDRKNYSKLKYPPFFADLEINGSEYPELKIDGYVGSKMVLSRRFSANPQEDQFVLEADDHKLNSNIADATRIVFYVADKYGSKRPFSGGIVRFDVEGPGTIVGDNPFDLEQSGGAGAIWVRTKGQESGTIMVSATHSKLGTQKVKIKLI